MTDHSHLAHGPLRGGRLTFSDLMESAAVSAALCWVMTWEWMHPTASRTSPRLAVRSMNREPHRPEAHLQH